MIPVYWVSLHPEAVPSGYWDQAMLRDLLDGELGLMPYEFDHREIWWFYESDRPLPEEGVGGIVVINGGHHGTEWDVEQLFEVLYPMPWVILIVTGDEEGFFRLDEVASWPNVRHIWVQSPRPERSYPENVTFFGVGYATGFRQRVHNGEIVDKKKDWFFSGSISNKRRRQLVLALRDNTMGRLVRTGGFGQGLPPSDYAHAMRGARVVPCPSGPAMQDSFRAYEAMEAGCMPLLDNRRPDGGGEGYWQRIFGDWVPGVPIDEWTNLANLIEESKKVCWRNDAFALWQFYKRRLRRTLIDQLDVWAPGERQKTFPVTVIVTTSPIDDHPSTEILEATIASIRHYMPFVEILLMFDGVRVEQRRLTERYEDYINKALHLCNDVWENVTPIVSRQHVHQSGLMRMALPLVKTPLLLFVEHDCPLEGEIAWTRIFDAVLTKQCNVVRLSFFDQIPEEHEYLMEDGVWVVGDLAVRKTRQWSQRPHVASADFYRWLMDAYFTEKSRSMIEDNVYGPCEERGDFGVVIYHPKGGIKRSGHLDGRGGEQMYEMTFDYPGETPAGAPHPGTRKVK